MLEVLNLLRPSSYFLCTTFMLANVLLDMSLTPFRVALLSTAVPLQVCARKSGGTTATH